MINRLQRQRKRIIKRRVLLMILALLIGTGVWAVNRFLIGHAKKMNVTAPVSKASLLPDTLPDTFPIKDASPADSAASSSVQAPMDEKPQDTVIARSDGINHISIRKTVTGAGADKITYYTADVRTSDIKEIKSCFADDIYGENIREKTSSMAARCNAVFAVNGDYYGYRSDGIIIRNGELFRDMAHRQGVVFLKNGTMKIYDENVTSGGQLITDGAWATYSFGPGLIEKGNILKGLDKKFGVDGTFIEGRQPRTAVGQIGKNHFVFVVVDGRQDGYSCGMTLVELADLMKSYGCKTAYNLDGGNSATMYFKGNVLNYPSSRNNERSISDCIFIN